MNIQKNALKNQIIKELKSMGTSLKAENKNFEGVCIEDLHNNKLKMYVGPDYGYDIFNRCRTFKKRYGETISKHISECRQISCNN